MTVTDRIEVNPKVMLGKPVIRGTRVPVELILRKLSEGATEDDLLDAYPRLSRQDIQAAIGYAADTLAHEETLIVAERAAKKNPNSPIVDALSRRRELRFCGRTSSSFCWSRRLSNR
jgi:uncharacterized protein (DUF433 family)